MAKHFPTIPFPVPRFPSLSKQPHQPYFWFIILLPSHELMYPTDHPHPHPSLPPSKPPPTRLTFLQLHYRDVIADSLRQKHIRGVLHLNHEEKRDCT